MIDAKFITYKRDPFYQIALDYIRTDSIVLDVGSGNGSFPKYCKRDDFFLLEGNIESVEFLKKEYMNVYLGKLPNIPFENDFFDLVHCSHLIEHLQPNEVYEFLKEADRVLKPNGIIVISAPLLWSYFYDDLSHVKPYNPYIFIKYMCNNDLDNLTRRKISKNYIVDRLEYRYSNDYSRFNIFNLKPKNLLNRVLMSLIFRLKNNGLVFLEKTGYTIVLRKKGIVDISST